MFYTVNKNLPGNKLNQEINDFYYPEANSVIEGICPGTVFLNSEYNISIVFSKGMEGYYLIGEYNEICIPEIQNCIETLVFPHVKEENISKIEISWSPQWDIGAERIFTPYNIVESKQIVYCDMTDGMNENNDLNDINIRIISREDDLLYTCFCLQAARFRSWLPPVEMSIPAGASISSMHS